MSRVSLLISLIICCSLLSLVLVPSLLVSAALPSSFKFGTATAAYQIEGSWDVDGKEPSEWDFFSHLPNKVANGDTGDVADDSYRLWQTDLQLIKTMGVNAHRFSLAWTRIIDAEGNIIQAGVDHYNEFIDALLANNIQPFVTMYHWDLPLAHSTMIDSHWGWLNSSYIVPLYTRYADVVFTSFGDRVKHWIVFNEPHSFCVQGFATGSLAPGRCSNRDHCDQGDSTTEPYLCGHSVVLAYSAVANLYRTKYEPIFGKGSIGMTLDASHAEPYTQAPEDAAAAQRVMLWQLGWWADPLFTAAHDYPIEMRNNVGSRLPVFSAADKQNLATAVPDFFGFNHYTSVYAFAATNVTDPFARDQAAGTTTMSASGELIGLPASSTWLYVVPWGFPLALKWIADRYENPVIYVTENGVDVPGESQLPLQQALNDQFRVDYLTQYLGNMTAVAIDQFQVNIQGYFVWSLLDNFEWADGYKNRFGLHYVDYKNNCTRYTKQSALWYANWIQSQKSLQQQQQQQQQQQEQSLAVTEITEDNLVQAQ